MPSEAERFTLLCSKIWEVSVSTQCSSKCLPLSIKLSAASARYCCANPLLVLWEVMAASYHPPSSLLS